MAMLGVEFWELKSIYLEIATVGKLWADFLSLGACLVCWTASIPLPARTGAHHGTPEGAGLRDSGLGYSVVSGKNKA